MGTNKLLCLITGPSGSGKTSIALELQKHLLSISTSIPAAADGSENQAVEGVDKPGNEGASPTNEETKPDKKHPLSVVVIHQDNYFTNPFISYQERVDDSYEDSSGIDWERFVVDIQSELGEDSNKKEDSSYGKENDATDLKVVIVEGHLLGDATTLFRQRFFVCESIGILGVFLVGCSQESCKHRRLTRKKDRTKDERDELAEYIDAFVWPSFLAYGVDAMDALRRDLVELAHSLTSKSINAEVSDSQMGLETSRQTSKFIATVLEIDNSEGASLRENVDTILNTVRSILSI